MLAGKVLPQAAAEIAGQMAAGATIGYAFEAGEKIKKGETPIPGISTAVGAAIPASIGAERFVRKYASENLPSRIINSYLSPSIKRFNYGKNPGRIGNEGIVANSIDDFATQVTVKRREIGENIGSLSKSIDEAAKVKNVVINLEQSIAPLNNAMKIAARENNKSLLDRLVQTKEAIIENLVPKTLKSPISGATETVIMSQGKKNLATMTFNDALEMKRQIGNMTKWTGNQSDDEAVNAALKRVWGNVEGNLEHGIKRVDPKLLPKFQQLNERFANATSAEIAIKHKQVLLAKQPLFTGYKAGAVAGGLLGIAASGGAAIPAFLTMVGGATLEKVLSSAAVRTRIAAWLAKATPQEISLLRRKIPNVMAAIDKTYKGTRSPGDILMDKMKPPIRKGVKKVLEPSSAIYHPTPQKALMPPARPKAYPMPGEGIGGSLSEGKQVKALMPPKPEVWRSGEGFAMREGTPPITQPQYPPNAGVRIEKSTTLRNAIRKGWTAVKGDETPLLLVDKSGRQIVWDEAAQKFLPIKKPYSAYQLGKMKDITDELYGIGGVEGEALPWRK